MSTCNISKYELCISIFEQCMTKFHELPKQPSYDPSSFLWMFSLLLKDLISDFYLSFSFFEVAY